MRKLKPKKGYYVSEYLYCILTPSCDSAELISSSVELLPVNVYMHNSFLYLKKKRYVVEIWNVWYQFRWMLRV